MEKKTADTSLRWVLRLMGTSSLTALLFVAAPRGWMATIHADLGLGVMPESPVFFYLARSTSAFYGMVGALFWIVSFDLERYRSILTFLGVAGAAFGVTLFAIDYGEGLPPFWTYWEGPFVLAVGLTMLALNRAGRTAA